MEKLERALEKLSAIENEVYKNFRNAVVEGTLEAYLAELTNLLNAACAEMGSSLCVQLLAPCIRTLDLLKTYARAIRIRIEVHRVERGLMREYEDFVRHLRDVRDKLSYVLSLATHLTP